MASTYTSNYAASGVQPRANIGETIVYGEYALTGALVVNDVIKMVHIPVGAKILEVILGVDALDSSTGVVTAVGDGTTADRFIKGATIGRSGAAGVTRLTEAAGLGYVYTANDTIDVKVTTAPSGTASTTGTIRLAVVYTMA